MYSATKNFEDYHHNNIYDGRYHTTSNSPNLPLSNIFNKKGAIKYLVPMCQKKSTDILKINFSEQTRHKQVRKTCSI